MDVYITYGTIDFLKKLEEKHKGNVEEIHVLQGSGNTAIIAETAGGRIFESGQAYKLIEGKGGYNDAHYVVMNHIPVREEERPLFEERFKNRAGRVDKEPGCKGIRILRPQKSDTYVVMTLWKSEGDFQSWQNSEAFDQAHKKRPAEQEESGNIFSGKPYIRRYRIQREED